MCMKNTVQGYFVQRDPESGEVGLLRGAVLWLAAWSVYLGSRAVGPDRIQL